MSAKLLQNSDGANHQARAVLEMVRYLLGDGIESSWDDEYKRYTAEIQFTRFDNCREQGYVIYLRDKSFSKQINIVFYEHRNSDELYVQINDKRTFHAPTLEDITSTMKDKWEAAFTAQFGEITPIAAFIVKKLEEFWKLNSTKKKKVSHEDNNN